MAKQTTDNERGQLKTEAETEISAADRAMGASMIASGIGSLVLGIMIVLSEVSTDIRSFLTWNSGVGPLSGKTGVSVIAFVASWAILHYAFQRRAISLTTSFIVTLALVALGFLLTFPPVFMSFGG